MGGAFPLKSSNCKWSGVAEVGISQGEHGGNRELDSGGAQLARGASLYRRGTCGSEGLRGKALVLLLGSLTDHTPGPQPPKIEF